MNEGRKPEFDTTDPVVRQTLEEVVDSRPTLPRVIAIANNQLNFVHHILQRRKFIRTAREGLSRWQCIVSSSI